MIVRICSRAERVEDDDLVDAVQELRPEVRAQRVHAPAAWCLRRASPVPSACTDRASAMKWLPTFDVMITTVFLKSTVRPLPSVSRPSSSSCSMTLSTSGCAFSISSNSTTAVRPPAHRFGELAGLLVADVAGRRADQPRHGVLLLVLRHVDPDHRVLVVEQELGERAGQLGLADAGRAEEDEAAERTVGILQARRARAGSRWRRRVIASSWPTTRWCSRSSMLQQLLDLAFHQPADRDVRPAADDLGDVLLVDLLLQHALVLLQLGEPRLLLAGSAARAPAAGRTAAPRPSRSRRPAARARISRRTCSSSSFSLRERLDRVLLLLPVRRQPVLLLLEVRPAPSRASPAAPSTPCPFPCAAPRARSRAA